MNITRFSIQRPVGITMVVLLFVVLGLYSFHRIGVELLPALNTPIVTVSVNYTGAGTQEMETQVIKPLENALSSVPHLKRMTSLARPQRADIILEFDFSANADIASIDATKQVNAARRKLPDGISEPVVRKRDMNALPIMEIAILSDQPLSDVYSLAGDVFQERLQRADGVSDVVLGGGRDKEIAVEVDKDKLRYFNVSLSQIASRIRNENVLLPAGTVYGDKTQADVRLLSQYKSPQDIADLQVTNLSGSSVHLRSLATITEQDARVNRYSRTNGSDAISLSVYMNSDANIVQTAQKVRAQLATLQAEYPGYQFRIITDSSTYVENSLHNTLSSLLEGLLTTSLVLYLFLRGWRSTAAVVIAIPTSLISTFFAMYITGFSFNMMSLMGMALCIGILVDDSIVVLENIHRHLRMGKPAALAAEEGRTEIGMAAIAITLCDVVVFMPIAFMTGMTGQFFRQFGLTIVFATLFSLFVSFTLTPMLASRLLRHQTDREKNPTAPHWILMNRLETTLIDYYEQVLRWSLSHCFKLLSVILALFIFSVSLLPLGIIGSEYMPRTDEGNFRINLELPVGTTVQESNQAVTQMENYIATLPEVTNYLSNAGMPSNNASLSVQLLDRRERSRSIWQITDQVRKYAAKNMPGVIVRVNESSSSIAGVSIGGMGGGPPGALFLQLLGSDMDRLIQASHNVQALLQETKGITDIRSSYIEGVPEIQLAVDRDRAKFYGTSVNDISTVFAAAIAGQNVGTLPNDPNNYGLDTDIVLRFQGSDSFRPSDIRSIPIQAGNHFVSLGDVATLTDGTGPTIIQRINKQRAITVSANISGQPLAEVRSALTQKLTPDMLEHCTYQFVGQAESMDATFSEMVQALALSLVLVYMLLAILYESFTTPLIRMLSLPLGIIGSLLILALTRNTINLYSLIGILVMDGLVAKNGTLLLDYTLTLMHKHGYNARDAIIQAGRTRLKPILMTTLTMIAGMLPTALALTEGSETRVSMAWVIIGGLLSSTVFTLIVIPIVFLFLQTHPLLQWVRQPKCSWLHRNRQK